MHRFTLRVYYEDTDLAGVVYYANYLKFIERARSEWLRDLGVDQAGLKTGEGIVFAVRRIEADYLKPARYDDLLTVISTFGEQSGARLVLSQSVLRGEVALFTAQVTLVCLDSAGRARRVPDLFSD